MHVLAQLDDVARLLAKSPEGFTFTTGSTVGTGSSPSAALRDAAEQGFEGSDVVLGSLGGGGERGGYPEGCGPRGEGGATADRRGHGGFPEVMVAERPWFILVA